MTTQSDLPSSLVPSEEAGAPVQRVGTIELFFDLVFVFALTQLTSLVAHPHGPADYGKALLVFMTLMWIYDGYVWLGGNVEFGGERQRRLIFVAMGGFFVMALSIPTVFDGGGLPYALGLLTVTSIHALMFKTSHNSSAQAIWQIAPYNFGAALLVLAAAFVHPPYDWPLWAAAVATLLSSTLLGRERQFQLSPRHFVERHGLIIIIALGESIVAVGSGVGKLALTGPLLGYGVLALMLSALLWWTYFHRDDARAEHIFLHAHPKERSRMAILGYGYGHFAMVCGIILIAAGLKVGVVHPTGHPDAVGIWNLTFGITLYLLGDVIYRRALGIGPGWVRLLLAAALLLTIPVGLIYGALPHLVLCVLLLTSLLWIEAARDPLDG
ncbi:low temperature requirement protein A [Deinococcus sp. QL22]|uniref:low temperature requirement protein A n=1 Tax=Deinococcus sp. QL22 TaxID=2939437 RepID=UPI002017690C|nr:low temperature requirement protein A [Deinococcus sp. QL22]UQN06170.1 low temperature requirement protein A [Deinococcus sp. QL22]